MLFNSLRRNERGAVAIEMAFALPVLTTIMIGILQFALVLQASGAMRHGIGEGLRMAKVQTSASSGDIEAKVKASMAGVSLDRIEEIKVVRGTDAGADYGQISIKYKLEPLIPFAAIPPIELNESKRIWLPS
ncbi:MAG: TadE/TadG family type IV pilus assembly protein [Sphingomonadaceae bacterium]